MSATDTVEGAVLPERVALAVRLRLDEDAPWSVVADAAGYANGEDAAVATYDALIGLHRRDIWASVNASAAQRAHWRDRDVTPSSAERFEAIRPLRREGLSWPQIRDRLGWSVGTRRLQRVWQTHATPEDIAAYEAAAGNHRGIVARRRDRQEELLATLPERVAIAVKLRSNRVPWDVVAVAVDYANAWSAFSSVRSALTRRGLLDIWELMKDEPEVTP